MTQVFTEETYRRLERKHLLLDTNFLLEAAESPDAFKYIFDGFIKSDCCPITFPLVYFEFLRTSFQEKQREQKKKLLAMIGCISLPIRPNLFSLAIEFGNYYAYQHIGPSLVDCCIAAMLKQHGNDLLLITRNHKDFLMLFFIREAVFIVERPKDILTFAAYRFNEKESKNLERFSSL